MDETTPKNSSESTGKSAEPNRPDRGAEVEAILNKMEVWKEKDPAKRRAMIREAIQKTS
jgi:hypothetical protein